MKHFKPVALGLAMTPWFWMLVLLPLTWRALLIPLVVPLLVAIALPFSTWDDKPTPDSNGQHPEVIRGDLPAWAWWLSTPDERLPGGTYEPAVLDVLTKYGKWICSLYWLGWRNQLHGLGYHFALPMSAPWPVEPGYYESGGLWWLRKQIGPLQIKAGWRQYLISGKLYGVPCCSITG